MKPTVVIDCFAENGVRYRERYAVVAVDVIRATTLAITAAAAGWRCFPVGSLDEAYVLSSTLMSPLMMGELGGDMPVGFNLNNSPAELELRRDRHRPIVLLSSSGTKLIAEAQGCESLYLGCLRNYAALAKHIAGKHERIAIIGAGSRGEFREEDQLCCAWIAELLVNNDYVPAEARTAELIAKWSGLSPEAFSHSKSVAYLRRTGQEKDLTFILEHVGDLASAYALQEGEVVECVPTLPMRLDRMEESVELEARAA